MRVQGGTKQLKKAAAPVKKAVATPIKKAVPKKSVGTQRVGKKGTGASRRIANTVCVWAHAFHVVLSSHILFRVHVLAGDALWLPNTERPAWLDGSLPGDRGFDPLGLAKPTEYLQACGT